MHAVNEHDLQVTDHSLSRPILDMTNIRAWKIHGAAAGVAQAFDMT
jgi:hypothetical protein